MEQRKYFPVRMETVTSWSACLRIGDMAALCGIHPELIHRFVRLGLLDPIGRDSARDEWLFSREAVSLVRKILRLRNELGINYVGVGVVLELLERIEYLEGRIRQLESRLSMGT